MESLGLELEKLVYSVVNKYGYGRNDIEDLYQIGMQGLEEAKKKFNDCYNTKFSTFAYFYIKGRVLRHINENRMIKVNKDLLKLKTLILKAKEMLDQRNMRETTLDEIASFLEVPINKIIEAIDATESIKSLDYELNDEGKELNLYDSIWYEEKGYNDEILDLKDAINDLDEDEKKLISLRYFQDKTQAQASKELGMTQVQVSRCESKILVKLNHKLSA